MSWSPQRCSGPCRAARPPTKPPPLLCLDEGHCRLSQRQCPSIPGGGWCFSSLITQRFKICCTSRSGHLWQRYFSRHGDSERACCTLCRSSQNTQMSSFTWCWKPPRNLRRTSPQRLYQMMRYSRRRCFALQLLPRSKSRQSSQADVDGVCVLSIIYPFSRAMLLQVLANTVNGTTYAGIRARTTGAPQNHWFGPAGDPRSAGIGTPEAIRLVWSCHREIINDVGPIPSSFKAVTT